jgi:hypothetical protein
VGFHHLWQSRWADAGKQQPMTYRVIYSLQIDLMPGRGGDLRELIVPLRPDGTGTNITMVAPRTRAIDLRDGDQFMFQGKGEIVTGIRAYRDNVTDSPPPAPREGYVFRFSDSGRWRNERS